MLKKERRACVRERALHIKVIHQPHTLKCDGWYYEGGTVMYQITIFCCRTDINQQEPKVRWDASNDNVKTV